MKYGMYNYFPGSLNWYMYCIVLLLVVSCFEESGGVKTIQLFRCETKEEEQSQIP